MVKLNKQKIKIIKKNTLLNYNLTIVSEKKQNQKTERQIATNVSGWINDLQSRRLEEQKLTFNQLFARVN